MKNLLFDSSVSENKSREVRSYNRRGVISRNPVDRVDLMVDHTRGLYKELTSLINPKRYTYLTSN